MSGSRFATLRTLELVADRRDTGTSWRAREDPLKNPSVSTKDSCTERKGLFLTWVVVAVLAFVIVGHGCHGADVDHEPGFTGPHDSSK